MLDSFLSLSNGDKVFYLSVGMLLNGVMVAPILTYILPAYYGRYTGKSAGILPVPAWLSWVIQESPAFLIPLASLVSSAGLSVPNTILVSIFCLHYFQRSFVYPMLMRSKNPVPISITFFAFVFCTYNGVLQSLALVHGPQFDQSWLSSPQFILGLGLFAAGFAGNIQSDAILRNLRKPGESGYKIPHGGVFEYVSAANYFCETLEWCGFAIACSNISAVSFAIYTLSNLLPRALSHHQWYMEKFDDYPKERKAFLPYLL